MAFWFVVLQMRMSSPLFALQTCVFFLFFFFFFCFCFSFCFFFFFFFFFFVFLFFCCWFCFLFFFFFFFFFFFVLFFVLFCFVVFLFCLFAWSFFKVSTTCLRTAKALARLRLCAVSPKPLLVAYVKRTVFFTSLKTAKTGEAAVSDWF